MNIFTFIRLLQVICLGLGLITCFSDISMGLILILIAFILEKIRRIIKKRSYNN